MEKSGKWLIIVILALALVAGGFSWWFRWSTTHRAADFWGPQAATTIRDAQRVEAFRLTADAPADTLVMLIDRIEEYAEASVDASQARGLLHFKHALLEDRSYRWDASAQKTEFMPRWAVVFHSSPSHDATDVAVLFDEGCTHCCFVEDSNRSWILNCQPISTGLKTLFADWFAAE